jgi:hypothetical protein
MGFIYFETFRGVGGIERGEERGEGEERGREGERERESGRGREGGSIGKKIIYNSGKMQKNTYHFRPNSGLDPVQTIGIQIFLKNG